MTLIITCFSKDYILQVSDRRLTVGQRYEEDIANKAVVLWNKVVFSFTGLANMEGERTDVWIARKLLHINNLDEGIENIRSCSSKLISSSHFPSEYRRMAFTCAFWNEGEPHLPVLLLISNYIDENFQILPHILPSFEVQKIVAQSPHDVGLLTVGQPIDRQSMVELYRYLRTFMRKQLNPRIMIRLMSDTIRKVSDSNPKVGKNLLAICLPREGLPKENLPGPLHGYSAVTKDLKPIAAMFSAVPNSGFVSFWKISENSNSLIEQGPIWIMGNEILGDFEHRNEDGTQTFSVRYFSKPEDFRS